MAKPLKIRDRNQAVKLLIWCALLLIFQFVFSASAFADAITPESGGSPNAGDIDTLYKLCLYVAIVIFVLVEGALIYSLIRYRASRGITASQIHGNTPLEIGWTIGAALILVVLTAFTFIKLPGIKNPVASGPTVKNSATYAVIGQPDPSGGPALTILVNGRQFIWQYQYPNGAYAYSEMVVPVNTTVILKLRSLDVNHSWWIPKLGGKADAVPGYNNETWFKADKVGIYRGQCAELCGQGHANMAAAVRVVPKSEYLRWVAAKKIEIITANKEVRKQKAEFQQGPNQ